jgi:competence protein ComEC
MTRLAMPLAPLAAAFATGIGLAPWASPRAAWALGTAAVALTTLVLLSGRPAHATVPLLAAIVALGVVRALPSPLPADHVARLPLPLTARVEGRLADTPLRWAPERSRLLVDVERVDGATRTGRVAVAVYGPPPELVDGQRVALDARLDRPLGFRNPGGFDSAARLERDGIHVTASAGAAHVDALGPPAPPWPARVRRAALDAIASQLPPVSAALLGGLLLGERSGLPPEVHEAFRHAGVYHVLAVSGFNVALLAGAVWSLLRAVGGSRRAAAVTAMIAVLCFAAVVGPEPSVVRATIMAVLILAAVVLEREASVTNSLALAALVILAVRPGDLFDPGFQLSFAATAGIVAAPLPPGIVAGALGVSLAAQLAVLPITLAHFNQLSTIGVAANLAVVPLAAAATILGLVGVATAAAADWLSGAAFGAVWPVLLAMRGTVSMAAAVPGAVLHLPGPGAGAITCYTAGLAAALAAWHVRDRRRCRHLFGTAAAILLPGAIAFWAWPMLTRASGTLRVTVLDVGQGDAIVVEAPDGRAMVVDAGHGGPWRLDAGERVVAPFLWNRGILRLAATVVTHADADHAGGMTALRRLLPVGETWDARAPMAFGGAWLTPLAADTTSPRVNDHAIVLRVELGLASILLASDIEAAAERALVEQRVPLAATVLKVPHHGAATSSTAPFLAAVRPVVAVISVGTRNAYGHPDAGALGRLAAAGARVYRTDWHGAVVLETDGRALMVTRWVDRRVERLCLDPESIC